MKPSRRTVLIILLLALFLLAAFLFRSFLLDNLVRPLALIFWLIWRLLLSVDQRFFWGALIFVAGFYAFIRLVQKGLAVPSSAPSTGDHLTPATIDFWRTFILLTASNKAQINLLKQSLIEMLARMYTASQPETPYWVVYEGLEQRQIPLPENIYTFLFPPKPSGGRLSLRQVLQTLRGAPARWARRWSGRAAAEYYQSLDEVLTFMESSLEINNADKPFNPHAH